MYQCKHFNIPELVPPELYNNNKNSLYKLWWLFPKVLLITIDKLRETYGPVYCNTYIFNFNKPRVASGLRLPDSKYYSETSQHSYANAVDLIWFANDVEKIRKDIIDKKYEWMKNIKGLELDVSWLHIDFRNSDKLITFKP